MNDSDLVFSHIVAASKNHVIGINNKLPWHIPEDLEYFKKMTFHKAIIMGRKTFESLGKALPNRLNLVLSRDKNFNPEGAFCFSSIQKAIPYCSQPENLAKYGKEIFIIGGGEIFKQTLPFVHRLYVTRIHEDYKGDAFYPAIPEDQFQEIKRTDRSKPVPFSFLVFESKNPKKI